MILTSSFLTVLENQASGTACMNLRLAEIINTFYDDHAKNTGFFMILKAVVCPAASHTYTTHFLYTLNMELARAMRARTGGKHIPYSTSGLIE